MSKRATTYLLNINDDHTTMVKKINTNFQNLSQDTTLVEVKSEGGGGGSITHQDLGQSVLLPNCHPITAITGLDEAISGLELSLENKADKATVPDKYKEVLFNTLYPVGFLFQTTSTIQPPKFGEAEWELLATETKYGKTIYTWERTE